MMIGGATKLPAVVVLDLAAGHGRSAGDARHPARAMLLVRRGEGECCPLACSRCL